MQLEDLEVTAADYIKPVSVGNFRKAWEDLPPDTEQADDYGLGARDGLQETVETLIGILGMHTCEGTEAVPPNARSHTVLLAGKFPGDQTALVRLSFGMDTSGHVAMKLVVRSDAEEWSAAVHKIIQEA